jgi:hypothetical protein
VSGTPDDDLQQERGGEPLGRALPAASTGGEPMAQDVKDDFALRTGHHFGRVRVHADSRAAELAQTLHTNAYGPDIFFGRDEYASQTLRGSQLFAHGPSHVVQQEHPIFQNQHGPTDPTKSVDLGALTDDQLQERYDLIASTLAAFQSPPAEAELLKEEAGRIGVELSRREALDAERTISPEAIEQMRAHFISNATAPDPASCIATLKQGLRLILDGQARQPGPDHRG